jgi:hypothetical protein
VREGSFTYNCEPLALRVSSRGHEPDVRSLPQVGEVTDSTPLITSILGAWSLGTNGLL